MVITSLVISILLTLVILYLSMLTITKGYGYKHTIDPLVEDENDETRKQHEQDHTS